MILTLLKILYICPNNTIYSFVNKYQLILLIIFTFSNPWFGTINAHVQFPMQASMECVSAVR